MRKQAKEKIVLILDFDGTFYSGDQAFSLLKQFIDQQRRCFLPSLSDEEYNRIVVENPEWLDLISTSEIAEYLYFLKSKYPHYKISLKEFNDWSRKNLEPIVIDYSYVVDGEAMRELCEQYHVYVVSNSSLNHIKHYMKEISVNPSWFKGVVSNQFVAKDQTKEHYYKRIMQKENVLAKNVYVFGDSEQNDLKPAQNLSMNTIYINDARKLINTIYQSIKK
jgi:FMN phosphatase YigB (HAD superfamily)